MEKKPRILVFASGSETSGGSGFQEMVECTRTNPKILEADIVGVVSHHEFGGVFVRSRHLQIPFHHWLGPFDDRGYRAVVKRFKPDYVMLSGWLKRVGGLAMSKTINIHPGPLPEFGGRGMFGHRVHQAVMEKFWDTQCPITQSAVTMHFVDDEYDHGPIICRFPVLIRPDDTARSLGERVNEKERTIQSIVLNLIAREQIRLIGRRVVYGSQANWLRPFSF